MGDARHVLVAVLVYGGGDVVPRCLASAARLRAGRHHVDVLVLDDCTPDEVFSEEVAGLAAQLGFQHYRSPRNLGVARNMNLALLRAQEEGYDYVVLLNSDTVVPALLAERVVAGLEVGPRIASFTPWSNNATLFSLPLGDADELAEQATVDLVDHALSAELGSEHLDVPTGVGFCLGLPVAVVREVGLMDPVFGRGYCEEVDWCQRAATDGYRNVLGFGTFVYHAGGASNRPAGLLTTLSTTVLDHERVVELRFPGYHDGLAAFDAYPRLEAARHRGLRAVAAALVARAGYELRVAVLSPPPKSGANRLVIHPTTGAMEAHVLGQAVPILPGWGEPMDILERLGAPTEVTIRDRGPVADTVAAWARVRGLVVRKRAPYPTRV